MARVVEIRFFLVRVAVYSISSLSKRTGFDCQGRRRAMGWSDDDDGVYFGPCAVGERTVR